MINGLTASRAAKLALASMLVLPAAGRTHEGAPLLSAPAPLEKTKLNFAVQYRLTLRLPEGRGLAALLIQAGVDQSDAALAARVAAGHLGDGGGGCSAKIEISRSVGVANLRLERIELTTNGRRAVIERRAGNLSLASDVELNPRAASV